MTREEAEKHFRRLYWAKTMRWQIEHFKDEDEFEVVHYGCSDDDKMNDLAKEWVDAHVAEEMRQWDAQSARDETLGMRIALFEQRMDAAEKERDEWVNRGKKLGDALEKLRADYELAIKALRQVEEDGCDDLGPTKTMVKAALERAGK